MVFIADGRYELPERYYYSRNQHVYLDKDQGLVGLDEIGYLFLKNPTELQILVDETVKVGEPFAVITTEQGITTLNSPCSGKVSDLNHSALDNMDSEAYTNGFILKLSEITEIDPDLVTGIDVEDWAKHEVRFLIRGLYSFKIIEIGDSGAGKTAIKVRFTDDYFKKDLKTTLGVDFGSKELKLEHYMPARFVYKFTAKMNVWDAAGQAHFEKMRGLYYREAKGALMVFDLSNPVSFQNLDVWAKELNDNVTQKIPVLLIGNKNDLDRQITKEEAEEYAEEHDYLYYECSAKTGQGVDEQFDRLAIEIFKREEKLE